MSLTRRLNIRRESRPNNSGASCPPGLRETSDRVESIGITRSRAAIADADISVVVLDASLPLQPEDLELLDSVPATRIIALNKTDLPNLIDKQLFSETGAHLADLHK